MAGRGQRGSPLGTLTRPRPGRTACARTGSKCTESLDGTLYAMYLHFYFLHLSAPGFDACATFRHPPPPPPPLKTLRPAHSLRPLCPVRSTGIRGTGTLSSGAVSATSSFIHAHARFFMTANALIITSSLVSLLFYRHAFTTSCLFFTLQASGAPLPCQVARSRLQAAPYVHTRGPFHHSLLLMSHFRFYRHPGHRYLVKWRGLDYEACTWERFRDIRDYQDAITTYETNEKRDPRYGEKAVSNRPYM